jgi:integrase
VKRFLQLAVERGQLDRNPLVYLKAPRTTKKKVRVYTASECERLLRVAHENQGNKGMNWGLLLTVALATGMRRGEILNTTWRDVNFENLTIEVNPKEDTDETWEWMIKDAEHRVLPLTEELVNMLAAHQNQQPEGFPYVFVPPKRYERIQILRRQGKWVYSDTRLKLISNFRRDLIAIQQIAGIEDRTFHDLRRTTLSHWLSSGMSEYDVMNLAGHSDFSTTHGFYLAVNPNLVDRARKATASSVRDFVTGLSQVPFRE